MRSSAVRAGLVLAAFTLLTLVVFRPTRSELAHTAPAFRGDAADALLLMWATSSVSRALFTDPLHLFDAGIFHPERHTLAFGDHMIGQALVGLPVWLTTRNPLLEFNLLSLASYALGGAAMFLYARELLGGVAPAAAAALVFAFTPFRFNSPLWLQVLFTPFLPLALLFWTRFVRRLAWRDWALWVACWVAHSLMGMYLSLYFALTMACLAAFALVAAPTRRSPRLWLGTVLGPLAALALLAPTLWPYVQLRSVQGNVRAVGLDTFAVFFLPGPGTLSGLLFGPPRPGQLGPGLVVWALAALGLALGGRSDGPSSRFVRRAHLVGLALTLALVLTPMRYQLLVPGLDVLRNANRAFFVTLPFLAYFVGAGVAWIVRRTSSRALAAGLVLLLAADMGTPPRERKAMPVGDEIAPAYRWLATLPPDTVVYEGWADLANPPLSMYYAIYAMYYAIFHEKRLAQGYSGFATPGGAYLTMQLSRFPQPEALRLYDAVGVHHVLWHFPRPDLIEPFVARLPPSVEVAGRFGNDVVFRLGPPPPPAPVAPRVAALPSTGWHLTTGGEPDASLHDGDPKTVWRQEPKTSNETLRLEVDLGRPVPVAGVRCIPPYPGAPGIYLAEVELSLDGERWEPTGAWLHPDSLHTLIDRPRALTYYESRFPTRTARYVRLSNATIAFPRWPWEIAELEIEADCAAAALPGCEAPPA